MAEEKYSFSKLECFENCGFQYFLKYIMKYPTDSTNIALLFGSLVHATEEKIAKDIQANRPIEYTKYINEFLVKLAGIERHFPTDYKELDKSGRNYKEKAYLYLEKNIYNLEKFMKANPDLEIIGIEEAFNFEFKDKPFRGFIDRAFKNKKTGRILIQDIKTYNVEIEKSKLITPLQFVVYCLAAEKLWGVKIRDIDCQYYMPLIGDGHIQDGGTFGFVDRGKIKLNKLFESIKQEKFTPNPSPLCHWCSFSRTNKDATEENKKLCPYHSNWTKNNKDFSKEYEWEGLDKHKQILESYQKTFDKIV